jgi:hypothetical protein
VTSICRILALQRNTHGTDATCIVRTLAHHRRKKGPKVGRHAQMIPTKGSTQDQIKTGAIVHVASVPWVFLCSARIRQILVTQTLRSIYRLQMQLSLKVAVMGILLLGSLYAFPSSIVTQDCHINQQGSNSIAEKECGHVDADTHGRWISIGQPEIWQSSFTAASSAFAGHSASACSWFLGTGSPSSSRLQ